MANTANLLNQAAQATSHPGAIAGRGAQAPTPPSATDVWTRTYDGVLQNAGQGNPLPALGPVGLIPTYGLGAAVLQGLGSLPGVYEGVVNQEKHSSSLSDVGTGMGQQAGSVADAFLNLFHGGDKPPPQGVLGHFGAFVNLLTNVEQLLSVPFSAIPFPALPAVRVMDLDVGLPHAHAHPPNFTPPATPAPVPLPSTGPVLPIPYVSGAATVLINGIPAARCGDMGAAVWCGGYFPFFEIFLGSSSVWLEGCRAARVGPITKHCIFSNPKSIVKGGDSPIGPPLGFLVGSSPNVLIGGFPLPSLTAMALGGIFKGIFKAAGGIARRIARSPAFQRFLQSRFPWLFRPVATATGAIESRFSRFVRQITKPRFLMSRSARDLLDNLQTPGSRHTVTSVNVQDLADITAHTGDEFGVVRDRHGNLVVIRGEGPVTTPLPGDTWLAHTHPHTAAGGGQHPLGAPGSGYQAHPMDKGWDPATNTASPGSDISSATATPEAQIYQDGQVTYFNNAGPMNAPPAGNSPIDANGNIDGNRH